MISPALVKASTDPAVRGAPLRVLVYLHGILDPGEYRTLKLWPVARALRMDRGDLGRAMRQLVKNGYLREGPRIEHGSRSYLVLFSCGEPVKHSA